MSKKLLPSLGLILTLAVSDAVRASSPPGHPSPSPALLVTGLEGATGSAIGPDGFLYVTEGATGTLTRVHPQSGRTTTVATGLPPSIVGIGGAIDVAFIGKTPYVLVTLVGPDVGGNSQVGIYSVDGRQSFTVIADIGAYALAHPPSTPFDVPTGVQYSLQAYAGGFLVTDGHHNRVLFVNLDGHISEFAVFDNIAPTGLAVTGPLVLMTQAGAIPHLPEEGKVRVLSPTLQTGLEVASGAPLLVDVEFGCGGAIYALAQGDFPEGNPAGSPALPDTGSLVQVNADGSLSPVVTHLNLPTSLEIIGDTAYIVSLAGEISTVRLRSHCQRP